MTTMTITPATARRKQRGRATTKTTRASIDRATWETTGRELRTVLKAVLPHAARPGLETLPVLTLVRFEVDGSQLHAIATNRYTLAVVRQDVDTAGLPTRFAVAVAAKTLESVLRLIGARDAVTLTFTTDAVTVDAGTFDICLPADPATGIYPKWRQMLGTHLRLPARRGEPAGFNPHLFALFQTARRGSAAPVVIQHRQGTPEAVGAVTVTCGDWFVGAIMPVRLGDQDGRLDSWLELCPPPAPDPTADQAGHAPVKVA